MLEYLKNEANKTFTENGAVTHKSTLSDCLDLFSTAGALRHASEEEIISRFVKAYTENKDIAMKLLFYARDIRGGLGERRFFRIILRWLAENEKESARKNLFNVAEFGRFDDLLALFGTPLEKEMMYVLKHQYDADVKALEGDGEISLLGKWLPSVNASNEETVKMAEKIVKFFGIDDRTYRKTLVKLRAKTRIIENNLREKDYTFDYSKQPSKAMVKYRKAFTRNDIERYTEVLNRVASGKEKLNTSTLYPYELIDPYLTDNWYDNNRTFMRKVTEEEKLYLNTTWNALPSFDTHENALAIVDTSGSMYWENKPKPASVALSLGLYFAEHNKGAFGNHFIEFSENPQLIEVKGDTFADRLRYIASFNEVANTNLESVFELVLDAAVNNHVPQSELPSTLIIISDMEFDRCVCNANKSILENAKERFEKYGYKLPGVVFWNVASRNRQQPVTKNEQGVILVSGCTPRLFSMIAGGNVSGITPWQFMLEVLMSERYEKIAA